MGAHMVGLLLDIPRQIGDHSLLDLLHLAVNLLSQIVQIIRLLLHRDGLVVRHIQSAKAALKVLLVVLHSMLLAIDHGYLFLDLDQSLQHLTPILSLIGKRLAQRALALDVVLAVGMR
jgi:hypothetical protein